MNRAEQIVHRLCKETFLALWSHENPRRPDSPKELCDALVVCGNDVIVFSVKAIELRPTSDAAVASERWQRRAVEGSVKQLYGASRTLERMTHVVQADGARGMALPPLGERRVHLVAVAFGSNRSVSLAQGDFGKGFVHVLDEEALWTLLVYLNTISDFVEYLRVKEDLTRHAKVIMEGGEEDMMAWYLHHNRSFRQDGQLPDFIVFTDGLWESIQKKQEFRAKLIADEPSFVWDNLINLIGQPWPDGLDDPFRSKLEATERVLRVMALEPRLSRRMLGRSFLEWHRSTGAQPAATHARLMTSSVSRATYVLVASPRERDRADRVAELQARCFVARGRIKENPLVVGLATETYTGPGFSFDACLLDKPEWTAEDDAIMQDIQRETDAFTQAEFKRGREAEYPGTKPDDEQ